MATLSQAGFVQDNLIDLTLLDDSENESTTFAPLFSGLAGAPTAIADSFSSGLVSHDGIIFDDASSNASFGGRGNSSVRFAKAPPMSPDRGYKRPRSPQTNGMSDSQNPAKRQRIGSTTSELRVRQTSVKAAGNDGQSLKKGTPPRVTKSHGNNVQTLEQTSQNTTTNYSDQIKRDLRSVLLNQILPHINNCLSRHNLPDKTANEVKRKVLVDLCGEILKIISKSGHDRLFEDQEHTFAVKAVRLVGKFLKDRILPSTIVAPSQANGLHFPTPDEDQDALNEILDRTVNQHNDTLRKPFGNHTIIELDSSGDESKGDISSVTRKVFQASPDVKMNGHHIKPLSKTSTSETNATKITITSTEESLRDAKRMKEKPCRKMHEIQEQTSLITREATVVNLDTSEDERPVRILPDSSVQKDLETLDSSRATFTNTQNATDSSRITGPPGPFILYRKDKAKIVARQYPGLRNWELSPIISAMWAKERPQVKDRYKASAEDIKRKILEKYPDWKPFRRKPNLVKSTKQSVTKVTQSLALQGHMKSGEVETDSDNIVDDDVAALGTPMSPSSQASSAPRIRARRKKQPHHNLPVSRGSTEARARPVPCRRQETALDRSRRLAENLRLFGFHSALDRPYIGHQARADIKRGLSIAQSQQKSAFTEADMLELSGAVFHVDFTPSELQCIGKVVGSIWGIESSLQDVYTGDDIEDLISRDISVIPRIVKALKGSKALPGRSQKDIAEFLRDAVEKHISRQPGITRFQVLEQDSFKENIENIHLNSILLSRETVGSTRQGGNRQSAAANLKQYLGDTMTRAAEWTDCSGDIATVTWMPDGRFVCGAITHSDAHNQQYNKPGNLLIGSVQTKNLLSVSGHKIPRPIVHEGQNSLESMRSTQDPWLYCSVSSTAYDPINKKCFTASYDKSVKIWDCDLSQSVLNQCGVWEHDGNVNFVVTSPNHDLVATAADVSRNAVRVYHFNEADVSASRYDSYSGARADELPLQQNDGSTTKWAYFPATIQWGKSPTVEHLLLVGYSPRSPECEDWEIPEDKLNTGELCLWNVYDGSCIQIASARTANVFEVVWHPTLPMFLAATSVSGEHDEGVRTQVRMFTQTEFGTFIHTKTLDCPALDINEITIRPNSLLHSYVTASCTDGSTYVFDTAQGDKPIHVLCHGDSIDDSVHGMAREESDCGVKFAAWGRTLDRFYTGSSDGVVKAWNVRASAGEAFLHDVICLSGGVSAGAFSPDFSKLVIGDATGKVHLLTAEGQELGDPEDFIRQPITPHAEPARPIISHNVDVAEELSAKELAKQFLQKGYIEIHPDEYIGAVQGPNYTESGLFCNEDDALITQWRYYQESRYQRDAIHLPTLPEDIRSSSSFAHDKNRKLDLDLSTIDPETLALLEADCGSLSGDTSAEFNFEAPIGDIFVGIRSRSTSPDQSSLLPEQSDPENSDCYLNSVEIQEIVDLRERVKVEVQIQRNLEAVRDELYRS